MPGKSANVSGAPARLKIPENDLGAPARVKIQVTTPKVSLVTAIPVNQDEVQRFLFSSLYNLT